MFMSNSNMIKNFSTIFAIFDHRRTVRSWKRIRIMWTSWICLKHLKNKGSRTKNSDINFTDNENRRLKIRRLIFCDNLTFCSMFSLLRRFNKISCSIKLIKIDQRWWKLISWKRRINDAYFVKRFITNTLSSFSFKTLIALISWSFMISKFDVVSYIINSKALFLLNRLWNVVSIWERMMLKMKLKWDDLSILIYCNKSVKIRCSRRKDLLILKKDIATKILYLFINDNLTTFAFSKLRKYVSYSISKWSWSYFIHRACNTFSSAFFCFFFAISFIFFRRRFRLSEIDEFWLSICVNSFSLFRFESKIMRTFLSRNIILTRIRLSERKCLILKRLTCALCETNFWNEKKAEEDSIRIKMRNEKNRLNLSWKVFSKIRKTVDDHSKSLSIKFDEKFWIDRRKNISTLLKIAEIKKFACCAMCVIDAFSDFNSSIYIKIDVQTKKCVYRSLWKWCKSTRV